MNWREVGLARNLAGVGQEINAYGVEVDGI
jgi:hypothetical protein